MGSKLTRVKTGYSKTTPKTVATPATASVVAPQPAPAAAATPAPAAAPISAPAPAPPKTDEVPAPTPDSTTAEPAAVEQKPAEAELTWTDMEDATLIGLKALNKTWKEIGAAIEGKHTEDLRARYDTLTTPPKEDANPEDKAAESSEAKTSDKVEETPGGNTEKAKEAGVQLNEGDPGKKAEKESKKKNKKGKAMSEEAQEKKAKAVEDKAQAQGSQAEAAKDKGGKGKPGKKSKEIKGILKKGGATPTIQSDEDPSSHDGRPIIYFDNGDGLDINEVECKRFWCVIHSLTLSVAVDGLIPTSSRARSEQMGGAVI